MGSPSLLWYNYAADHDVCEDVYAALTKASKGKLVILKLRFTVPSSDFISKLRKCAPVCDVIVQFSCKVFAQIWR